MTPQEMVERALASAQVGGCIAIAEEISDANLRWAGNTLTTNGISRSRRLTVIAIEHRADGMATGAVSRTVVRDDQVAEVVGLAEHAAGQSPAADDAQPLADAGAAPPSLRWDQPVAATEFGVFGGFTGALGDAFAAANSAGHKLYGFAEHQLSCNFLGTSSGLRLRHDQPFGRVEFNAKSADMERSAWLGGSTRDFTDVVVADYYGRLAQRLDWAKRRVTLPAGRYETLLGPAATADLFVFLYEVAGARDAFDGRTVFSKAGGGTRVGERLAQLPVTLRSDPAAPGIACAPFLIAHASGRNSSVFDNGLTLQPTDWISEGRLAALIQTRYSAGLTGMRVTPTIPNLIFRLGDGTGPSVDEMIGRTDRGVLAECLWYIRVADPRTLLLTGLTRDGTYLVEHGEVTGAVNNFRFNESPVGMLGRLAEVGGTAPCLPREWGDEFPLTAAPPLRVDGFNMSSVSQAH
jgi:predicted Zn-dependent protease